MIEAMNYSPLFRDAMLGSPLNDSYFLIDARNNITGSFWLYIAYYNSVQNLWFLLASQNAGGEKVDKDPVEWLNTFDIGKEYLQYLQSKGIKIDKSDIFYLAEGLSLKDALINWIQNNKREHIKIYREISKQKERERDAIEQLTDPRALKRRREMIRADSALLRYGHFESIESEKEPDEESISPSLSSGSEVDKALSSALIADPEYMQARKEMEESKKRLISEIKKSRVQKIKAKPY